MVKMLVLRAYTYRLYPAIKPQEKPQGALDLLRELYNAVEKPPA